MTIEEYLNSIGVNFIRHEHPAVFTVEEAEKYCGDIPGLSCKNLLLKAKKEGEYYLVIMPAKKRMDLKKLAQLIGIKSFGFASPETLKELLGLEPGSVSPFGLINDKESQVNLILDQDVYDAKIVSFHPNVNTATLEITQEMFRKFLHSLNREFTIVTL